MSEDVHPGPSDKASGEDAARRRPDKKAATQRRLAEALRANLRRRKAATGRPAAPEPVAPGAEDDGERG